MRVFAAILLIPLIGALAAGLWGLALMKGDVKAFVALIQSGGLPAFPSLGGGGLGDLGDAASPADQGFHELVAAHVGSARLGPGDSRDGVVIEQADLSGAVVSLPTGQRITLSPTDGYTPMPGFSRPDGAHLGLFLTHDEALPIGLRITDFEAMRTIDLRGKLDFYSRLAQQIAARPAGATRYEDVTHDARGVFYCSKSRWSDDSMLVGARIDRGLLVVAALRPGCGEADDADIARLAVGARAITPERWR